MLEIKSTDVVSITQIPNTDGFDGHCLRAAYYYKTQLPHVDVNDPVSVNSIAKSHKHLRQESKTPTFALTYQGTYITLMQNLGWTMKKAKEIEAMYHTLYAASSAYIDARIVEVAKVGYATVAFGLRVRAPMLYQVVWGSPKVPYQAKKEARTIGNAMGQSYGLLNNRAANEFMEKVWASPFAHDIVPVALIHDAIYLMIREDLKVVEFANTELITSMRWQNLPELQHPTVKIGAALDLFWPSWATPVTLPLMGTQAEIAAACTAHADALK